MVIILEVLGSCGHKKYAPMTPEETERMIANIEAGKIEECRAGPYYVMNKNTKRLVGKVALADNQELVMVPVIRGG